MSSQTPEAGSSGQNEPEQLFLFDMDDPTEMRAALSGLAAYITHNPQAAPESLAAMLDNLDGVRDRDPELHELVTQALDQTKNGQLLLFRDDIEEAIKDDPQIAENRRQFQTLSTNSDAEKREASRRKVAMARLAAFATHVGRFSGKSA